MSLLFTLHNSSKKKSDWAVKTCVVWLKSELWKKAVTPLLCFRIDGLCWWDGCSSCHSGPLLVVLSNGLCPSTQNCIPQSWHTSCNRCCAFVLIAWSLLRRSLMASRVLKHLLARYALPRMSMPDFAAERWFLSLFSQQILLLLLSILGSVRPSSVFFRSNSL